MEKKEREQLKERFMNLVVDDKREKITVKDLTATAMMIRSTPPDYSVLLNFIEKELDRAREEGKREYFSMGMEYFSLIEDSNIYQEKGWKLPEEKAKRLQILDKIFNLLKTKE